MAKRLWCNDCRKYVKAAKRMNSLLLTAMLCSIIGIFILPIVILFLKYHCPECDGTDLSKNKPNNNEYGNVVINIGRPM